MTTSKKMIAAAVDAATEKLQGELDIARRKIVDLKADVKSQELTKNFQVPVGNTQLNLSGSAIYESRRSSPVHVVVDATTTSQVSVTVSGP